MKKLILFLLLPLWAMAQTTTGQEQEFDYGIKNNSTQTITTPPYLTTTGMDGTQGKIPSALIAKTSDVADSLATKENVANKSDSYTTSSSITYVSGKALVEGLSTKIPLSEKGATNGVATLGSDGKVPNSQIPALTTANIPDSAGKRYQTDNQKLFNDATSSIQAQLNSKENSFTKNTAFNKNFGTTAGTVAEGNDSRILNGQTAFGWGNHASAGYALTTGSNINQSSFRTALGLGSNAYSSTSYLPLTGGTLSGSVTASNGTLIGGTLTSGYLPKATGANSLGNSLIYENSGSVIISSAKNSIGGTVQLDGSWTNGTVFGGDEGDKFLLGNSMFLGGGATLCGANSTLNNFASVGITGSYIKFGINADEKMRLNLTGNFLLNTTADDRVNKLQVNGSISATSYTGSATLTGTPTAPTAAAGTNTTQIATTAFVMANTTARPYKVYTALLSQTGTNAPTATVLENTLGGTIVWGRSNAGFYTGTLTSAFPSGKTFYPPSSSTGANENIRIYNYISNTSQIRVDTYFLSANSDGILNNNTIEIRVYN